MGRDRTIEARATTVPFSYRTPPSVRFENTRRGLIGTRDLEQSQSKARVSMVVVEPLEINNEAACPLKVLSHLGSNKRKRERNKEGERIVIEILLLLPLSLSLYLSFLSPSLSLIPLSVSFTGKMMTARASSRREGQNHNKANN